MSECLEGFVSAVKALFPISTQTYHQEGKPKEYTLRTTFSSPYFLSNPRVDILNEYKFTINLLSTLIPCIHMQALYLMSSEIVYVKFGLCMTFIQTYSKI